MLLCKSGCNHACIHNLEFCVKEGVALNFGESHQKATVRLAAMVKKAAVEFNSAQKLRRRQYLFGKLCRS